MTDKSASRKNSPHVPLYKSAFPGGRRLPFLLHFNCMNETTEMLLATGLVAKELRPLIALGTELTKSLLGQPLQIVGSMLGDQLYLWRIIRSVTMVGKAKDLLMKAGVEPRILKPGYLMGMLDAAATTDDDDLHNLIAKLLASAVANEDYEHPIYRTAATQMNSDEAKIVLSFARFKGPRWWLFSVTWGVGIKYTQMLEIPETRDVELTSPKSVPFYFDNLQRLGMIGPIQPYLPNEVPSSVRNAISTSEHSKEWLDFSVRDQQSLLLYEPAPTRAGTMMAAVLSDASLKKDVK